MDTRQYRQTGESCVLLLFVRPPGGASESVSHNLWVRRYYLVWSVSSLQAMDSVSVCPVKAILPKTRRDLKPRLSIAGVDMWGFMDAAEVVVHEMHCYGML